jgi:hypothetical protein
MIKYAFHNFISVPALAVILLIMGFPGIAFPQSQAGQGPPVTAGYCMSPSEMTLYTMINEYRERFDLPPIPVSRSLCFVASTHVKDLYINHPDKGACNSHSWSDKGPWKPFCYPKDENKKNSVWDKPKEITPYKGKGYEIVYWENNPVTIDSIIPFWKSIDYFNSFLMNTGKWQGKKWNAIGIGIYENYAAAWFGELYDPEGAPIVCGSEIPVEKPKPPVPVPVEKKPVPPVQKTSKNVKPPTHKVDTVASEAPPVIKTRTGLYYIIVKSQVPMTECRKTLDQLKAKGYTDAKILEKDNKLRVSIMELQGKTAADSALRSIKKIYRDAWLLKN